jgi:hypothetical protein
MSDNFALFQCGCPSAADSVLHPYIGGACPQVASMVTNMMQGIASMVGFLEFGTPSNPPVFYRAYTASYSGNADNAGSVLSGGDWDHAVAASAGGTIQCFDPSTGAFSSPGDGTLTATTGHLVSGVRVTDSTASYTINWVSIMTVAGDPLAAAGSSSASNSAPTGNTDLILGDSVDQPLPSVSWALSGTTTLTMTQPGGTVTIGDDAAVITTSAYTATFTLTDPDTEADALGSGRFSGTATPDIEVDSSGNITLESEGLEHGIVETLRETRGAGSYQFLMSYGASTSSGVALGAYINNLFTGLNYKATFLTQKRAAVNNSGAGAYDANYGAWAADTSIVVNFTAASPSDSIGITAGEADGSILLPLTTGYQRQVTKVIVEWVP